MEAVHILFFIFILAFAIFVVFLRHFLFFLFGLLLLFVGGAGTLTGILLLIFAEKVAWYTYPLALLIVCPLVGYFGWELVEKSNRTDRPPEHIESTLGSEDVVEADRKLYDRHFGSGFGSGF
ncbi:MAG: hypothetical protein D6805_10205 [Planctomycetota bacterium]|nr:MAG: hypothetical protein D6805_10205 [Planctomycetota bacterium]